MAKYDVEAIAAYAEWLAGLKVGDEVAAVTTGADDWAYVAEISRTEGHLIYLEGIGDLAYYYRETGMAPGIYRQRLAPVTDEIRARSNHHMRARRLGDLDWSKLPPKLVREIAVMVGRQMEVPQ